ncbi:MAG: tRNA (adenosine(37)-N6)-dimethylallyltransferase MiaA [Nitrospirae bacterium RBG_13_39_12]|nr:MAG: tRNA (adenosine(37)-N6)-dimethylallyltransferase MiaA [Nitrospirae bacterium RBG_13_39_12]
MNKVLILLGPTGVGKTGVSLLLAKSLDTEIISADSMQIYRHMDIGTAKPLPEERAMVKHHIIDIVDPWESYSTGRYIGDVVPVINKLLEKGKIPIVVGGTGLYIKAMTRGIFSGPSADWSLRDELLSMEKEEKGILYNYIKEIDPEAAHKITPNDTRRIIRALEVCLKSKETVSEMQRKLTRPLSYSFIKIGLSRDRKELYKIIEKRVDKMIIDGLVNEVKKVIEMIGDAEKKSFSDSPIHRLPVSPLPSMQAIGYKETAMYLNGKTTLDESIRLIKRGSKRYAKRQFTWFRKEKDIHWFDITGIDDSHEAFMRVNHVLRYLL